jgi:serine/threonine-protein kinase
MQLSRLGKYEIVAKIGEGGMGNVYRAHDPLLKRDVAIKTMGAGADSDHDLRRRFLREAQSAAGLNHRNVITIFDFGEEHGHLYIAMELLDGADLKQVMARQPGLSLGEKLDLVDQIADGLAFAHANGVIHRDLKPANIHLQPNGQVKIVDFGLARVTSASEMTRAGTRLGTPNYMSPEQVRGEKAGTRSDVFSLAVVFYEVLAGRRAFDAKSTGGVLLQVMQDYPPPLDTVNPELAPVALPIQRAMLKDPAQRFAHAGELRDAFREARKGTALDPARFVRPVPVAAPPVPAAPRPSQPRRPDPPPPVLAPPLLATTPPAPEPSPPAPAPPLPLWVFGLGAMVIAAGSLLCYLILGYFVLARSWSAPTPTPSPRPTPTRRALPASPAPRPTPTAEAPTRDLTSPSPR